LLEYLTGPIKQFGDSFFIIEVGGIGLRVIATQNTVSKLRAKKQDSVLLQTYLHITENKWEIFGFSEENEREAFLLLLDCRGIGTKAAINILNTFSPARLRKIALGEEPVTVLQQVPGIGAKSADRILVELKEKIQEMSNWDYGEKRGVGPRWEYAREDLYQALRNLGYRNPEIQMAISKLPDLPTTLSEAVKQLLRMLGK